MDTWEEEDVIMVPNVLLGKVGKTKGYIRMLNVLWDERGLNVWEEQSLESQLKSIEKGNREKQWEMRVEKYKVLDMRRCD